MSGGSLNYFCYQLQDHVGDFGDKELDELVKDLAELFHDREWYLSADYCEGDWNESRDKFKAKWFTKEGRKKRIDKYLADSVEEIKKSLGISDRFCKTCKHWERKSERYGKCEFLDSCLAHRAEYCEKWAREFADELNREEIDGIKRADRKDIGTI